MGALRRTGPAPAASLFLLGLALFVGSCTSQSIPQGQCVFDSDCDNGLVCAARFCRTPCHVDGDCPANNRCRAGSQPDQHVCVPVGSPTPCQFTSDCDAPQICTRDGLCQSQCLTDYDCQVVNPHQTCQAGLCVLQCVFGTANCNNATNDGCEVDILASSDHCGSCGSHCDAKPHSIPACAMGHCQYTCLPGWGDCDNDLSNGCEADLSQPAHCGSCTRTCSGTTGLCQVMTSATGAATYTCAATCGAGLQQCGTSCSDTTTDPQNCGACGTVCPSTADAAPLCTAGHCMVRCLDTAHRADCDGNPTNGCEAQLSTDTAHCGTCGTACAGGAHATAACSMGTCGLACAPGFGDCDLDPTNGCETDITATSTACGMCSTACPAGANATPTCAAGACGIACAVGFGDCDGNPANGCEADLRVTPATCGACGTACTAPANATATCAGGVCGFTCNTGHADCDGNSANGCEATLGTDPANCGGCGMACSGNHSTPTCTAGVCGVACATGYGDCDTNAANGCETNLTTNAANCGMCRNVCAAHGAGARCAAGVCSFFECAAGTGDCDGIASNGCETNLLTSVANCGACGNPCALPHATATCAAGACGVLACATGFADCNHNPADGCEVDTVHDPGHCGGCATACSLVHGTPTCTASACGITCATGFGDCDHNPANGCEVDLTSTTGSCGACGAVCAPIHATGVCTASHCGIGACLPGFADCDGNPANGCEVDLTSSTASCGTCGHACSFSHGAAGCSRSTCTLTGCDPGWGDCDGNPANGCEANLLTTVATCGACGRVCAPAHATAACVSGACSVGACATGWSDCDGLASNGCETDITTSNVNCGACRHACTAGTVCSAGACSSICGDGSTYCSGACVNTVSDTSNCGACGHVCPAVANAAPACSGALCGYSCNPGFGDCDGNPANGCETNTTTTVTACGGCGMACSSANGSASCAGSLCAIACTAGYGNCDGNARTNGCEAALNTPTNCGACGASCAAPHVATPACLRGTVCTISACAAGWGDCNGTQADGCEVDLTSTYASCGACGTSCAPLADRYGVPQMCQTSSCHPANDHCTGATAINLAAGAHIDLQASTVNATHDFAASCGGGGGADVYFTFTLTQREMVYADTFGMSYDTVLSFASGCTTAVAPGTVPGDSPCNDDATSQGCTAPNVQSQVMAVLNPGTYYLVLSGYGAATGTGTLHVEHFPAGNGNTTHMVFSAAFYSTTGTTAGTGLIRGTCGGSGPENQYWLMTCPESAGGRINAATCPATGVAAFDTVLYLNGGNTSYDVCDDDTTYCTGVSTVASYVNSFIAAGAGLHLLTVDSYFSAGNYSLVVNYPYTIIGDRRRPHRGNSLLCRNELYSHLD